MALKFRAKAKDEIPAEQQGLHVERDGEVAKVAGKGTEVTPGTEANRLGNVLAERTAT